MVSREYASLQQRWKEERWEEWKNKGGVERVTATLKAVHKNSSWWKRRKPLKEEHIEKYMRSVCNLNDGYRQPLERLVKGYRLNDFEYDKLYKDFKNFSKRQDKRDAKQEKFFEAEREREFKEFRKQIKEIEKAEKAEKRAEKPSFMDKLKGWFKKEKETNAPALGNKVQETVANGNEDKNASKPGIPKKTLADWKKQIWALQGRKLGNSTPEKPVKETKIPLNALNEVITNKSRQ